MQRITEALKNYDNPLVFAAELVTGMLLIAMPAYLPPFLKIITGL